MLEPLAVDSEKSTRNHIRLAAEIIAQKFEVLLVGYPSIFVAVDIVEQRPQGFRVSRQLEEGQSVVNGNAELLAIHHPLSPSHVGVLHVQSLDGHFPAVHLKQEVC